MRLDASLLQQSRGNTWMVILRPIDPVGPAAINNANSYTTKYFNVAYDTVDTWCGKRLKGWMLEIDQYLALLNNDSMSQKRPFSVKPVPAVLLKYIQTIGIAIPHITPECKAKLLALPSYQSLFPYQVLGVEFAIARDCKAMICDEMGLGKTRQAITILHFLMEANKKLRALIICPASLRVNWVRELHDVIHPHINTTIIPKPPTKKKPICPPAKPQDGEYPYPKAMIQIASYAFIAKQTVTTQYDVIICDESHYLKSTTSKRFKAVSKLVRKRGTRLVELSGTPSTRTRDLYAQLRLLDPKLFNRFSKFRRGPDATALYFGDRYCNPKKVFLGYNKSVVQHNGLSRGWELHALLQSFMIRRDKGSVLPDLPTKERRVVHIDDLNPDQKSYFSRELSSLQTKREQLGSQAAERELMRLMRESNMIKTEYLERFMYDLFRQSDTLELQNKYLIFAHHHATIDGLARVMKALSIPFIQIDGRTSSGVRQSQVDQFQNNRELQVAILGITAAGTGLNLFKANKVMFAELTWNQNDILQAECRAHRIGQTRNVDVTFIILKGSMDDVVWRSLNRKTHETYAVLDNRNDSLSKST